MNHVRFALAAAVSLIALVACGDEIPTQEEPLFPAAPESQPKPEDAGVLTHIPCQNTKPTDTGRVIVITPGAVLEADGCTGAPEPADNDSPLPADQCGTLVVDDGDAYTAQSSLDDEKTIHFEASGDAQLLLSGPADRTVENGGDVTVPKFPVQIGFTVIITSPSNTPQSYRITYK